jgi:anti-sigma B factor antagonist
MEACVVPDPVTPSAPARAVTVERLLRCETRVVADGVVVAITGELDLSTIADVETEVAGLPDLPGRRLIVDLRGLQFIDSTGLRLLIALQRRGADGGPLLSVVPGPPQIQRVFALAGLDALLEFVGPEAVDA